jgi:hypothetical protein
MSRRLAASLTATHPAEAKWGWPLAIVERTKLRTSDFGFRLVRAPFALSYSNPPTESYEPQETHSLCG